MKTETVFKQAGPTFILVSYKLHHHIDFDQKSEKYITQYTQIRLRNTEKLKLDMHKELLH